MYRVYLITNLINGKQYVGMTSNSIEHRFREHIQKSRVKNVRQPICKAINKYGKDNFKIELLEDNISDSQINSKEKYYIEKYNTQKKGYNVTEGGSGMVGYVWTEEAINRRNENLRKSMTPERNAKISKALKGRPFEQSHKDNLSNSMKKFHETHDNSFKGKQHTEESKRKMSVSSSKHTVQALHKETFEVVKEFINAMEAAKWIMKNNPRDCKVETIRGKIARHCLGIADCQTGYGYRWRYKM